MSKLKLTMSSTAKLSGLLGSVEARVSCLESPYFDYPPLTSPLLYDSPSARLGLHARHWAPSRPSHLRRAQRPDNCLSLHGRVSGLPCTIMPEVYSGLFDWALSTIHFIELKALFLPVTPICAPLRCWSATLCLDVLMSYGPCHSITLQSMPLNLQSTESLGETTAALGFM